MFEKVSMTGTGIAVYVLIEVLSYFNVVVDNATLTAGVVGIVSVASLVLAIFGQLRRKDMKRFLLRK